MLIVGVTINFRVRNRDLLSAPANLRNNNNCKSFGGPRIMLESICPPINILIKALSNHYRLINSKMGLQYSSSHIIHNAEYI